MATRAFRPYVLPLTVVILVALFSVQSHGTARVSAFFAPITPVWFSPSPSPAAWRSPPIRGCSRRSTGLRHRFLFSHGIIGLLTLGAVFLVVTGSEALYNDLGHFGRRPIQTAWLSSCCRRCCSIFRARRAAARASRDDRKSVLSALSGLGALSDGHAGHRGHGIASQAVITGAYSITRQAMQLGFMPRMEVRHTSEALFRADLHAAGELVAADRRAAAGIHVPVIERARCGLCACRRRPTRGAAGSSASS